MLLAISTNDPNASTPQAIIFFDGVCNFCNSSVNFIIKNDPQNVFKFASLQSEFAQQFIGSRSSELLNIDSIILFESDTFYVASTAALRIARRLKGGWKLFSIFLFVPRFLRDPLYHIIARNRYKWFGKKDTCRIPTPDEVARFLG